MVEFIRCCHRCDDVTRGAYRSMNDASHGNNAFMAPRMMCTSSNGMVRRAGTLDQQSLGDASANARDDEDEEYDDTNGSASAILFGEVGDVAIRLRNGLRLAVRMDVEKDDTATTGNGAGDASVRPCLCDPTDENAKSTGDGTGAASTSSTPSTTVSLSPSIEPL